MGAIAAAPPPATPVPLDEVKAFLRIAASDEDALLAGLVRSAGELCEGFVGRLLIERPVEETLAASTGWTRLGAAPVRSIDAVAALFADGGIEALPADGYAIDIDAAADGWVRLARPIDPKRVRVSYVAGMAADPNGVPEAIRHGIVRLAGHLYQHRDRAEPPQPPAVVTALWQPWRRLRLG